LTILFDLDGTLIDSTEAILESFYHTYGVFGMSHPAEGDITKMIGHPLDVMYRDLGIKEEMVWDFVAEYKKHYRKISREKTFLLDYAHEAIVEAGRVAQLGIVTTKTARYSRELLEHFGVMHHFEVLIGREDVENPKPHREPVDKAIELLGCDRERCWLIGDTRLDAGSANSAGIKCIGVTSGYDSAEQLSTLTGYIEKNALEAVRYIVANGENNTF
jgi:phosphoglycolate phosphatase